MGKEQRQIHRIACVGEAMIELIAGRDGRANLGVAGDTFNTAVYLARALRNTDVSVSYVTALGTDPYSERIMTAIRSHGLGTECIERRASAMPGLYAIDTDNAGERSFSYWRSNSAARSLFSAPCDIGLERLNEFDLVFLSGISLAILPVEVRDRIMDWANSFRAGGGAVAYDSNFRPQLWENVETAKKVTSAMWSRTDIGLPSLDDEFALFGDQDEGEVLARLAACGVVKGALKRGGAGPRDLSGPKNAPALSRVSNVVDSTAAGDSFNAGYLASISKGESTEDAMRAGHQLATIVIGKPGAIVSET